MNLPTALERRILKEFPDRGQEILKGIFPVDKPQTFRINSAKISLGELNELIPDPTRQILWEREGVVSTQNKKQYSKNPLALCGLYYFQSLSSMLPVRILDVRPGDAILDACASPGSKSTQILHYLQGEGFLVSNEVDKTRIGRLIQNISEWGAKNIWICQQDTRVLGQLSQVFDKILVDAPCSGEGTFYKDLKAIKFWTPDKGRQCARIQKQILENLLPTIKVGGELVYSTCTLSIEENEDVVNDILKKYGDSLELVSFSDLWEGGERGRFPTESSLYGQEISEKTRRILPYHPSFEGEGFFIAKFRIHRVIKPAYIKGTARSSGQATNLDLPSQALQSFWKEMHFSQALDKRRLLTRGYSLFIHPLWNQGFLSRMLSLLRPIYVGCRLGTVKNKWIEPTYEWALQGELLSPDICIDLDEDSIRPYLLGESQVIAPQGVQQGFVVICYRKYPLGIGKILSEGILKSKFSLTVGKKIFLP